MNFIKKILFVSLLITSFISIAGDEDPNKTTTTTTTTSDIIITVSSDTTSDSK